MREPSHASRRFFGWAATLVTYDEDRVNLPRPARRHLGREGSYLLLPKTATLRLYALRG